MAMTTLLTLAAMFGAVRQNTPRVTSPLINSTIELPINQLYHWTQPLNSSIDQLDQ